LIEMRWALRDTLALLFTFLLTAAVIFI
jgi:hypothetical protein